MWQLSAAEWFIYPLQSLCPALVLQQMELMTCMCGGSGSTGAVVLMNFEVLMK
jgi:hypothetical protein